MNKKAKKTDNILLVNFDQAAISRISKKCKTNVFGGHLWFDSSTRALFHFDRPLYECRAVFVYLGGEANPNLDAGVDSWKSEDLRRYISRGTEDAFLVIFLDNMTHVSLHNLGLSSVRLEHSAGSDNEITWDTVNGLVDQRLIDLLGDQTKLPQVANIVSGEQLSNKNRVLAIAIARNRNDDVVAVALSHVAHFRSNTQPEPPDSIRGLIVPGAKNLERATLDIIGWLQGETLDSNWQNSDIFYPPNPLEDISSQIETTSNNARAEIQDLENRKNSLRTEHQYLKRLLTSQGDDLSDSVRKVLGELLGLEMKDSDATNKEAGKALKEDFQIKIGDKTILVEVKGTNKASPPEFYRIQLEKNARKQSLNDADLCLVLNYDLGTAPEKHRLAYVGENSTIIDDIYFIDTRVLHAVALDLIDGTLTSSQAEEALFGSVGRVNYEPNK